MAIIEFEKVPIMITAPTFAITIFLVGVVIWYCCTPWIYQMSEPIEVVVCTVDDIDTVVVDGSLINLNQQYGRDFQEGDKLRFYKPVQVYCRGWISVETNHLPKLMLEELGAE